MPATAAMLNMHHHRAKFGCTLCYAESDFKEGIRYYPNRTFKMRDNDTHHQVLQEVTLTNKPTKGVKGPTKLSAILKGLPLTAPVDCMHQIYLGVTKVLLGVVAKKTANVDKKKLDDLAASIKVSIYFPHKYLH